MNEEWDLTDNSPAVAEEARAAEQAEYRNTQRIQWAEMAERQAESRRQQGYFEPSGLNDEDLSSNFPHSERYINDHDGYRRSGLACPYTSNRLYYVCHNCGAIGFKASNDVSELFKCYCCRSRNMQVLRSGQISLLVREANFGVNMQEVYNERRERLRRARAERSAARRNS